MKGVYMASLKTGKEIVDNWHKHSKTAWFEVVDKDFLVRGIDAALREARAEGEITGWEKAFKMVKTSFGKNK